MPAPVLFLDVDGVLNRTGFRPVSAAGLRSWIEPELAARVNDVCSASGASLVLSSSWREGRTLDELRAELAAAGITAPLVDATPILGTARWREIEAWLSSRSPPTFAIVDDAFDMGPLSDRFVRTSPLTGLDAAVARSLIALLR